ncbi:MAG: hypothetical protein WC975_10695 [Phycisphaerae bacterium]
MKDEFSFAPRIIRSPWADFYHTEIETALQTHPDDYLKEIADEGFNGVWLHGELRHLVPTNLFPNVGAKPVDHLRRFTDKLRKHNLKLYFYVCEPRGLRAEDPFWKKYPQIKGQPVEFKNISPEADGIYYALCSSTPAVGEYLEEGMYNLFHRVPGLGGIFCITASELHTHCYSHYSNSPEVCKDPAYSDWMQTNFTCPRCRDRDPIDVVAEIITQMNRGVKRAAPAADVIAWTWSWVILESDPQKKLISKLPKDVILMSDWERGGQKKVCGKTFPLDEYSFSYPGPSPRYKKQLSLAHKNGLRMMAKIQIGTTHELASVPYLPLPHLLATKLQRMQKNKVDGYLGCWILGGDVSPMSKLTGKMSRWPQLSPTDAIRQVADEEFGPTSAGSIVQAWQKFSNAWREYPFSVSFIYWGPINWAVAYPLSLSLKKRPRIAGWMPLPRDEKGRLISGDNYDTWLSPFPPKSVVGAFDALLEKWGQGINLLEQAMENDPDNQRLKKELNLARHIALSIRCTIDLVEFFPLYRKYQKATDFKSQAPFLKKLTKIFERELAYTTEARALVAFDPRLGFHPEANEHLYTLEDIDYKIWLLRKTLSSASRR